MNHVRRPLLTVALALACVAAVVPGARAESSGDAAAKAREVERKVADVQRQVDEVTKEYDAALAGVASSVQQAIAAGQTSDELAAVAETKRAVFESRIRNLYMAGGPVALYATLLDAGSATDFAARMVTMQRIVAAGAEASEGALVATSQADRRAQSLQQAARSNIRTERDVAVIAARLAGLLAEQEQLLAQANARVASLKALEARLAAQKAAAAAVTTVQLDALRVLPASAEDMSLYKAAAATCDGLSWTVLAAIGQVERGHGRDTSTSYAGAMGPMQFLPDTFAVYGLDGNGDGQVDIMNPADAIYSAAAYLCANGAGAPDTLYQAIWDYNHADWYVQMVLTLARLYGGGKPVQATLPGPSDTPGGVPG